MEREDFVDFASLEDEVEETSFKPPEGADPETERVLKRLAKTRFTSRARTGPLAARLKDLERRINSEESK